MNWKVYIIYNQQYSYCGATPDIEKRIKKQVEESFDTIKSQSASEYITEYHELEKLGLTIKNERNQKMLNKIRTKEVLNFLWQEQLFDQEMFKRIRDYNK